MQAYAPVADAMRAYTEARNASSADEIWLLEHPAIYTLGRAARESHVLTPGDIALLRTDRGGQVSYHGPGQLVIYLLIDLGRRGLGVRNFVHDIEAAMITVLSGLGITATRREGAPGVYVDGRKIGALGLRVRHGRSYHGLSLNVDMDLAPFTRIDPCGYPGLEVTQIVDLLDHKPPATLLAEIGAQLAAALTAQLGYNDALYIDGLNL
jgi:lipoyl(octanoyl) transferase